MGQSFGEATGESWDRFELGAGLNVTDAVFFENFAKDGISARFGTASGQKWHRVALSEDGLASQDFENNSRTVWPGFRCLDLKLYMVCSDA